MKKIISIICSFFFINGYCQESEMTEIITSIAEELASDENNPEGAELFIHQLYELAENPVKINSGEEKEISRLFFLSDFQVKVLADYVKSSGNIVSVYEIAAIPGFDRQTAEWMTQFISLSGKPGDLALKKKLNNTLLTNLTLRSGEKDSSYLGSPLKILTKYRFSSGSLSGGFTAEKDPGEEILSGSPPLPDFLSAHISYSGRGIIRRIILGDFAARFGLGTNINTGMRTGLSLNSPGYLSGRNELKPWTSTDENKYFRGAAVELSIKKAGLILFYSSNMIDATLGTSADSSKQYVDNLYGSGLHNTPGLLSKKDALKIKSFGINLTCDFKSLRTGITWTQSMFSIPFPDSSTDPEKLFDFTGLRNNIFSFHYNYLINRILLFGEFSATNPGNYAIIQGMTVRPSDRFSVNFLYRNYSPGFISFHGKGPGNSTMTNNEKGLLGNFSFEIAKHFFITAGCDISHALWLKYRTSFPSLAKRYEVRLKYLPDEKYSFDLSYNFRSNMYDLSREQGIASVSENNRSGIKGVAKIVVSERLSASTRVDFQYAHPSGSKGMLMLQDINYRFRKIPLTIWIRYCIFRTDDWNSRLYTYENDLLYSFSIPVLSGDGTRSYIMLKWDIKDFAELRLKYGFTEKQVNGSGLETDYDFKMQFRLWF